MEDKITRSPHIRFAGFTDDWEQRKLSEISDKVTEKNTENNYDETLTNSAEFGIVSQRDFFDKEISNAKNLDGYYVVKNDDFVYNPRISNYAPVGPIKRNKLGRNGVMSPLYYVFRTHDIDRTYLEHYFSSTSWHNFMKLNGDSGARADRFAIKDSVLREMPIPYPTLEEQAKIGEFIDRLADIITLHQRKLELLKMTKKSMLQKMFPKDGGAVPEIRFAGFTENWEQIKFNEIFIERREKTKIEYEDTLLSCAIEGMFLNSELFNHFRGSSTIGYLKVKKNDLILSSQNLHLGNANVNLRFESGIISPAYKVYNIHNCNPHFIQAWVKKDSTKNFFLMATTEGASQCRKNIEWNVLNNQIINVPSLREQEQIGAFFNNIDNLLIIQQNELDLLKDLKKSMLQKMFI